MAENIEITGGADAGTAAAIAAVVASIEAEEKAALATRKAPVLRSQWIEVSRPNEHIAPLTPEEYGKRPGQPPPEESPI